MASTYVPKVSLRSLIFHTRRTGFLVDFDQPAAPEETVAIGTFMVETEDNPRSIEIVIEALLDDRGKAGAHDRVHEELQAFTRALASAAQSPG